MEGSSLGTRTQVPNHQVWAGSVPVVSLCRAWRKSHYCEPGFRTLRFSAAATCNAEPSRSCIHVFGHPTLPCPASLAVSGWPLCLNCPAGLAMPDTHRLPFLPVLLDPCQPTTSNPGPPSLRSSFLPLLPSPLGSFFVLPLQPPIDTTTSQSHRILDKAETLIFYHCKYRLLLRSNPHPIPSCFSHRLTTPRFNTTHLTSRLGTFASPRRSA